MELEKNLHVEPVQNTQMPSKLKDQVHQAWIMKATRMWILTKTVVTN